MTKPTKESIKKAEAAVINAARKWRIIWKTLNFSGGESKRLIKAVDHLESLHAK